MKFKFKYRERRDWQQWFCWYPVKVGAGDYRWLETVVRRWAANLGSNVCSKWEYATYKGRSSDQ